MIPLGNPLRVLYHYSLMQPGHWTTQLQGLGIAILRVMAGYLFLVSGAYKLYIQDPYKINDVLPASVNVVLATGELLCGAALVVGLLTRWASVSLALLMLADVLVFHPPQRFFEQDHGYEYALLRLAASVALVVAGPGKLALDNILTLRRRSK